MWALTRFAHAEFWKAFRWRVGTPAARDFLWLTIFFVLASFLTFFAFSARQGLWERFEQVLLGALPGSSPPVRVNYHFFERTEKITPQLLGEFRRAFPELSIVPMRRIDGELGAVILPGLAVPPELAASNNLTPEQQQELERKKDQAVSWGLGKDGTKVPLSIFALPLDAPIWRWVAERAGSRSDDLAKPAPLVVAASTTLFSRHFRYEKYRDAIVRNQLVPCPLRSSLPAQLKDPNDPTELTSLILEVREAFGRTSFHAFEVVWIKSFPLPDQVAFIMPLPTVELLLAAESRRNLEVHLEDHGRVSARVQQIWLRDIEGDSPVVDKFRKVATCLGAVSPPTPQQKAQTACNAPLQQRADCEMNGTCTVPWLREDENDLMITATQSPLRRADVAFCAAQQGLGDIFSPDHPLGRQIKIDLSEESPAVVWAGPGRVMVPCDALVANDFDNDKTNTSCRGQTEKTHADGRGTAWLPGYPDAMVYANEQSSAGSWLPWGRADAEVTRSSQSNLKEIVKALIDWRPDGKPVFTLDPAYESALVRFGVLSTLVERISTPMGVALLVLYFALAYVILATAFWHRRAQYGLLAMNGLRPWQIQYIGCVQIMLACFIGCAVGYVGCLATVAWVNDLLAGSDVVKEAAGVIGLDVPNFLGDLSPADAGIIWLAMSYASVLLGCGLLFAQGVSRFKAPIELIKS